MGRIGSWLLAALAVVFLLPAPAAWSAPVDAADSAAVWLQENQNADGSWGTVNAVMPLMTSEAVIALRAYGLKGAAYYRGIAWLENNAMTNTDFKARRILSLLPHGDDISADSTAGATASVGAPTPDQWWKKYDPSGKGGSAWKWGDTPQFGDETYPAPELVFNVVAYDVGGEPLPQLFLQSGSSRERKYALLVT
jgi:hypothetical protein